MRSSNPLSLCSSSGTAAAARACSSDLLQLTLNPALRPPDPQRATEAVPKKILELMNVEGLTRENVASHLQKYRLYLKRVQVGDGWRVGKRAGGRAEQRR